MTKEKMRIRYLATRGGFLLVEDQNLISKVKLEVDVTQELYIGETGKPVRAIEKPDTIFTGWSDGVKSNPRTDIGNKNDFPYKEVIANFKSKYTLWDRIRARLFGRR